MVWRLVARRGTSVIRSGSRREEPIRKRARSLRREGWKVKVYRV